MHDKSTIARSVVIRKITSVSLVRGRKLKIEMWLQIIAESNCRTVTLNDAEWDIDQSEAAWKFRVGSGLSSSSSDAS